MRKLILLFALLAASSNASAQISSGTVNAKQFGSWSMECTNCTGGGADGIIRDGTGDTTQANVSNGRLHVDGSDVTQPVSGTVTANIGTTNGLQLDSTFTGRFPAAFASADNITAQTATFMHGGLMAWDSGGGNWDRLLLTSGALHVNVQNASFAVTGTFWQATQPVSAASLPLPTGAATAALQDGIIRDGTGDTTQANVSNGRLHVDGSDVTQPVSGTVTVTATNLDVQIGGSDSLTIGTFPDNEPFNLAQVAGTAPAAHDALMSGDAVPFTQGCFAETAEDSDANTNANRVSADADKVRALCDRNGVQYVRLGPPHRWAYHENSSSALTDTTAHAACGANLFNYIESVTFSIGGATAASVLIEDSTTTPILGPYYLEAVAGRGLTIQFPGGRKQSTANTLVSVTTTGAVAHGLDITGFCAP